MRGWRGCRPHAITILLATTFAVGACQREYEPIEVWDPNRPAAPSSQVPGRVAVPVDRGPVDRGPAGRGAAERGVGERAPAEGPIRPPSLPSRRGDAPHKPAAVPSASTQPVPVATARPTGPGGTVVVQRGETLFAISRRTGVPVRALIDANGLKPPYGLRTGQRVQVPASRYHEVQPGDTLYSVSRRYGVAMSSLVRDNNLEPPYSVRLGERLKIPSSTAPAVETMVASAPPPVSGLPLPSVPPTSAPPASPPSASPPSASPPSASPSPGQVLVPPASTVPVPQTGFLTLPPGYAPDPVLPPSPPGRDPAPSPDRGAPPPPPAVAALPPPPVVPPAASSPPPREGRGFIWPVRGQVVTRFGPTGRGLHNDGINIAAPKGSTVVAAESGVVAYAGNELRGFGNLLLVKHADGWITAYAHNDALLVKRGERIRRGQAIARVGQTGNVSEPQLHFELRRGTRAVDPAEYLDSQSSKAGEPARATTMVAALGG